MVSSDSDYEDAEDPQADAYATAWKALNKLMRRGWSWSGNERHCAYWQDGSGRFQDVSRLTGLDLPDDGRAAAVVDWDEDGDQDLLVTCRTGPRVRYLAREGQPQNGFVSLVLQGTRSNPDAVGARVELSLADGTRLVRAVRAGSGYLAQSSGVVHFGLGPRRPERAPLVAVVRWPGGASETFEGLTPQVRLLLREGSGQVVELQPRSRVTPAALEASAIERGAEDARVATAVRLVTLDPVPVPRVGVTLPDGSERELFGIAPPGEPVVPGALLVVLTADWCAPCRAELASLVAERATLDEAGVRVLALATDPADPPEARAAASATFEALGWPFARAFVEADGLAVLDALQGILRDSEQPLSLPSALLLDGAARVVAFYEGALDPARVAADAALCALTPEARRSAAAFSQGIWLDPPAPPDAAFLEGRFLARGLERPARELARAALEIKRSSPADLRHDFGRRAGEAGHLEEAIAHFRAALEADPRHFESWRDLGVALHRAGDPGRAVDAYAQALRLQPEDATTHYYCGLAFLAAGDEEGFRREQGWLREKGSELAEDLEIAFARGAAPR